MSYTKAPAPVRDTGFEGSTIPKSAIINEAEAALDESEDYARELRMSTPLLPNPSTLRGP